MSRGLEHYICASEDRDHYNNTYAYDCYYYPPRPPKPNIIVSPIVNVESKVSQEELRNIVNERLQALKQTIVEEIKASINIEVTNEQVDAVINEIYGGSASDVMKEE